jgi:Type II CAAX prenyl endopeptidase Rce1-like
MAKTGKRQKHDVSLFPAPDSPAGQHYYYVTQRPWPSLVFILPMLLIFEVMTYVRHHGRVQGSSELVAAYIIEWLIAKVGTGGFYFPGMLVIAILLAWHVAARHPWRFDPTVLPGMLGESLVWTLPLFVFSRVIHTALLATASVQNQWVDQMIRGLGAGIYEELVFRLMAITALVIVIVDVLKLPRLAAAIVILLASALLFAAQHHPPLGADPFDPIRFIFRTAAGLYLAGLFVFRGFGIAAGCHALYNVIAVTIDVAQT